MPSLFLAAKQSTYRAQRVASQGAGITLTYGCGEFTASMDCVARITPILGTRGMLITGETYNDFVPTYAIPFEDAQSAITKLSEKYSVALVDSVCDAESSRFVLIWKVERAAKLIPDEHEAAWIDENQAPKEGGWDTLTVPHPLEEVKALEGILQLCETTEPTKHTFDPDEF